MRTTLRRRATTVADAIERAGDVMLHAEFRFIDWLARRCLAVADRAKRSWFRHQSLHHD